MRAQAEAASARRTDTPTLVVEWKPGRAAAAAVRLKKPPQVATAGA
jgi:hypothetical protein